MVLERLPVEQRSGLLPHSEKALVPNRGTSLEFVCSPRGCVDFLWPLWLPECQKSKNIGS